MAKKTKIKRKIDDFKTKKPVNDLTISIVTNGKKEIKKTILNKKKPHGT